MKSKIIYFLVGLGLLLASFSMRITTIDPVSLALIDEVETYDTTKLWKGFEMSSYTKDIWYNFNKEFRYQNGKITEKQPDDPVVGIEALKLDGKPLIKAISFDKFKNIYGGMGGVTNQEENYKSVFVHESFHCYQMQHGLDMVHDVSDGQSEKEEDYDEFMGAIEKMDKAPEFKKLWEAEYMGLLDLYDSGDADNYKKAKAEKEAYIKKNFPSLFEDLMFHINYKQFIEGTAQLVQDKYMADQTGVDEIKFEDRVFYKLEKTFYTEGELKARTLDKYNKDWRENLSFDEKNNLDLMMERGRIL